MHMCVIASGFKGLMRTGQHIAPPAYKGSNSHEHPMACRVRLIYPRSLWIGGLLCIYSVLPGPSGVSCMHGNNIGYRARFMVLIRTRIRVRLKQGVCKIPAPDSSPLDDRPPDSSPSG